MNDLLKILFLSFMTMTVNSIFAHSIEICHGWQFKQARGENWYPATVPGTVHTDLLANGIIEDPFVGLNERGVQWVDKEDWVYQTTFNVDEKILKKTNIQIEFEGLDTYADVYLNDSLIIKADNMFRRWNADVRSLLRLENNLLRVYFHSPVKVDMPKWEAIPYHYEAMNDQSQNGGLMDRKISVFARKAGYHYGWDWGPRLVTSGIWRKVYLQAWDGVRITDVHTQQLKVNKYVAQIRQTIEVISDSDYVAAVRTIDTDTNKKYINKKVSLRKGLNRIQLDFSIKNPKLWWSNGLGDPHLYGFKTEVRTDATSDYKIQKIGVRSLRLLTANDSIGQEFCFELNGIRVFAKGANYIPNDNFLPRVTDDVYQKVINDAVNVNMNMLRVWGGGVYEDDRFYDLCDANGILVWQDFMFACSLYPASGDFLENVRQEAIDNVKRLRNHSCIALWCGNNECQDGWYNWGWKRNYESQNPKYAEKIWKEFEDLFYKTLPDVVKQYSPETCYWPSSPFGGYGHGSNETNGDYHYWSVWHAKKPIAEYNNTRFRFCSEYGMQSFPEFESVKLFVGKSSDWDIYSEVMMSHQRGGSHANHLIETYLLNEYHRPKNFESLLYVGQLMQGDAMKTAIESHRREKGYCWGTLFWQINDCWPVASWSTRDYYGRWKAAHYMSRNAFNDVLISPIEKPDGQLHVYIVNDRLKALKGKVSIMILDMNGNEINRIEKNVCVSANASQDVLNFPVDGTLMALDRKDVVIEASFTCDKVYKNVYYLCPPKDVNFFKPSISSQIVKVGDGYDVVLKTDKVARGVFLSLDGIDNDFTDNYFDLLPFREKVVHIRTPFKEDEIAKQLKITSLADVNKN